MTFGARIALALGAAASGVVATSVKVLTDADFYDEISNDKPHFVMFYAPWCGHCKRLAPDWEKLASEVVDKCVIAKVDATVETVIASDLKIRGYPTLKLFSDRLQYEYNGGRDMKAMAAFCNDFKTESTGRPLPMDESLMQRVQEFGGEYQQKVTQIMAFEPSLLPIVFFVGVFTGLAMLAVCQAFVGPVGKKRRAPPSMERAEEKPEEKTAETKKDE